MSTPLIVTATLLTVLLIFSSAAAEVAPGMAKATFAVHCYDVGARALEGKPGVISIERGWSGSREVDRVVYNPKEVSLMQLEDWLRDADTYVSTLEQSTSTGPARETSR